MEEFKSISGKMELQIDLTKPSGGVIRLNSENGCILRICNIPKNFLLSPEREVLNHIDFSLKLADYTIMDDLNIEPTEKQIESAKKWIDVPLPKKRIK